MRSIYFFTTALIIFLRFGSDSLLITCTLNQTLDTDNYITEASGCRGKWQKQYLASGVQSPQL
ncbi:hypothetical protein TSUD_379730 [Trifolium subterraneum]|uniref:Secreted protein n=1 Tax=Trifolium subterraneum TaxID=3900 RepID=A0A2Z6MJ87_TRISU|nr:hypothetical protein TSUD_379730 [Trifolium subterraneum]